MKAAPPDTDLINDLKKNDFAAFNAIYTEHSRRLYLYLLDRLKDPDRCNDVLQDIFVSFWEKRESLSIAISIKAYLYQAARYKIIDIYREDVKYQKYLAELAEFMTIDASAIIDRIDNRKKLQIIDEAVKELPEKMREIFILSRYEHQSTREIAEKTRLSPQTVKNQLSRALRILRINFSGVEILFLALLPFLRK